MRASLTSDYFAEFPDRLNRYKRYKRMLRNSSLSPKTAWRPGQAV